MDYSWVQPQRYYALDAFANTTKRDQGVAMTQIEAMKMALDALLYEQEMYVENGGITPAITEKAITALREAIQAAEKAQEPVAYSVGNTLHWHEGKGMTNVQLYAAPPAKTLSDERIEAIYAEHIGDKGMRFAFARAIEMEIRNE